MSLKNIAINIVVICLVVILPHTGFIPNFGYSVPILLFVWLYLKFSKETFSDVGFSFKGLRPKTILIGSLVAVFILCFMQFIFLPAIEYFKFFEEPDVDLYNFIRENKWQYIFIIIMGWLVGGLYEEIVFHGFIFSRLERMIHGKYSTHISFIGTAIIFGAYHFQLGAIGLINAFIVGAVYLALFLYFKRNLWYSIFCHGTYNTIVITLIYYEYL